MSEVSFLEARGDAVLVDVFVVVRASRTRLVGVHDGRVKVQIAAPPVDGAANKELVRFFARALDVSRSAVKLLSGESSRRKRIEVSGVSVAVMKSLVDSP